MDRAPIGSTFGVSGFPRLRLALAPLAAVLAAWTLQLYLVPLVVGRAVGGVPLRIISSGIQWDQSEVTLNGYRLIVWSPVVCGILLGTLALHRRPTRFSIALGLAATTLAATLLVVGGGLGIGPGTTLLVGTELRWVWKLCIVAGGLAVGLVGPVLIKTRGEDHEIDIPALKRNILLGAALLGALLLVLAPGPMLGKAMSGAGSWLGSLVWLVAL